MKIKLCVGSYAEIKQDGIVFLEIDTDSWTVKKLYGITTLEKPSWVSYCKSKNIFIYTLELKKGQVGTLVYKNNRYKNNISYTYSTFGSDPCHIYIDETHNDIYISNYSSGSLTKYKLTTGEGILDFDSIIQYEGKGVHPLRQQLPHVHFSEIKNDNLYVINFGLDKLYIYSKLYKNVDWAHQVIEFPKGVGPRHLVFHPFYNEQLIYVCCELSSEVIVLKREGEKYKIIQRKKTVVKNTAGKSFCSSIKIYKQFLFVANRGDNSISMFRIDRDGFLYILDNINSGGDWPRDFEIVENNLVVANQYSNNISAFHINTEKEKLIKTDLSYSLPQPSCLFNVTNLKL